MTPGEMTPRLRRDAEQRQDRRVSWVELFFDLVFVVLIARLSHDLEGHLDPRGIGAFLLKMLPIWWIWMGTVVYQERFEGDDLGHRLLVGAQVLGVAVLATTIEPGVGGAAFALSYVVVRGISVLAWFRAGLANAPVRHLIARETVGYAASLVLWTLSAFASGPLALTLRATGLLLDLATPALVQAVTTQRFPKISSDRAAERFGLFTIIVLGESLSRAIAGVPPHASLPAYGLLAGAVGLAFGWWWLYFDRVADRHPDLDGPAGFTWAHGHLPLFVGVVLSAAAVTPLIAGGHEDGQLAVVAFVVAVAMGIISLAALTRLSPPSTGERRVRPASVLSAAGLLMSLVAGPSAELAMALSVMAVGVVVVVSVVAARPVGDGDG